MEAFPLLNAPIGELVVSELVGAFRSVVFLDDFLDLEPVLHAGHPLLDGVVVLGELGNELHKFEVVFSLDGVGNSGDC